MMRFRKIILAISVLSIAGGVIGFYVAKHRNQNRSQSEVAFCFEYRDNLNFPSIIAIGSFNDTAEYVRVLGDTSARTNISFVSLEVDQRVLILDRSHPRFPKIGFLFDDIKSHQQKYAEYWIWHDFLRDSPR
jgi:hypothetical protein